MTSERVRHMMAPDPLSDIAALIRVGAQSGDPAAIRAAEALDHWRPSRNATLEQSAGRATNVRATAMQRQRDAALMRIARRYPDQRGRTLAKTVHDVMDKCEDSTAWRNGRRPDGEAGYAFDVLANGGALCEGHLRAVLKQLTD
jgi:hypothetical protein